MTDHDLVEEKLAEISRGSNRASDAVGELKKTHLIAHTWYKPWPFV